MAVVTVLVAGLLVEADVAVAAPVAPASTGVRGPADPVGTTATGSTPTDSTSVGSTTVVPAPAAAAGTAFGATGSLVALVGPPVRPAAPAAVHRAADGWSAAGDVDQLVPSASLVKLYLAEGVLTAARSAGVAVPESDLVRITAMLTTSDDQAASDLWVAHAGPAVVADVAARYGLTGTAAPADDPGAWGRTTTTAADLARFLTELPDRAHPDDAGLVLDLMSRATPIGADGFDQSFGLLGPARTDDVAAKQGWMCCVDGQRNLHSVGVVDGRVVVLLATFPAQTGWSTARAAVDAAAAAIGR